MARMSKLDRMAAIESGMNDHTLDDFKEYVDTLQAMVEQAQEAIEETANAAAEAVGYHEEREWESRNDSMETVNDALTNLRDEYIPSAIDALGSLSDLDDRLSTILLTVNEAIDHADHVIEA